MNFGLTLNVAISLTFVYVLASLLASTVNEMIAGVLKLRGVYLTKAIESLTSLGTNNQFAWAGSPVGSARISAKRRPRCRSAWIRRPRPP